MHPEMSSSSTADGSERRHGGPIHWMAGHSVTANILMVVLLVGGLIMANRVKKEVFPDFELDRVNISVAYPGASPEEVERGIILAIEEGIQGIEGIKTINSTASEGSGFITVEVLGNEDIQRVAQDIKNAVDRVTSFPEDIETPQVIIAQRRRSVISLVIYGDQSETVLRETAERIRDRLLQDADITQVDLSGVRDFEISIEIPQATLRTYGMSLGDVASVIRRAAVEIPGGAVKTAGGDILIRVADRRDLAVEFGRIPVITTRTGAEVLLEDIAVVRDGFAEVDVMATYNGRPAVMIDVYQVGDQTPVALADTVRRYAESLSATLPPGLALDTLNDRSKIYRQRMDLMLRNGYIGLALVFILLAIFLEPRLAFWVSLGIPISIFGAFLVLPSLDVTINIVSMFAFIVTLGIVVDDAVVAGENIYHHRQRGKPWFDAAVDGAREVKLPVVFSVLTNMVAFVPILFVPGFMGKVFREIPIVVICVFIVSLVESLLILPAHLGHQRESALRGPLGWVSGRQQRFSLWFIRTVRSHYGAFLGFCLRYRYVSMSIATAILILTVAYVRSGRMGFELFPKIESDYAMATATLPYGSAFQNTLTVEKQLVAAAKAVAAENGGDRLVEGIFARINQNDIQVRAFLTPPGERPLSTARVTELWRGRTGPIAGLESLKFESDAGGPGHGPDIAVELSHRDVAVLEAAADDVAAALGYFPNVNDPDDGVMPGKQQIDFHVRPEARSLGLLSRDVATQVRHAFYGAEALRQQRGRNEVKVMVRFPRAERSSEHHLEEMILLTPSGSELPLAEAVSVKRGRAYTTINRHDGRRVVTVSAYVRPRSKADEVMAAITSDTLPALQGRYPGLSYSFEGRQADRRESMESLMQGLFYALLVIFAMLAIPFNSFTQPLIVMCAIPFGVVGAVIGHLIMGYSLSVMSMFGVVALSGVVINDSLVMVAFANRSLQSGAKWHDAILEAGIHRFRPILLTTLTTFGGLSPMIFETSRQARFLIPMALSLGYGIIFATAITLVLVPCLYGINEDIRGVLFRGRAANAGVRRPTSEAQG